MDDQTMNEARARLEAALYRHKVRGIVRLEMRAVLPVAGTPEMHDEVVVRLPGEQAEELAKVLEDADRANPLPFSWRMLE